MIFFRINISQREKIHSIPASLQFKMTVINFSTYGPGDFIFAVYIIHGEIDQLNGEERGIKDEIMI